MKLTYDFTEDGFEYEVYGADLKKAIVDILCQKVKGKGAYEMAKLIVFDLGIVDELYECLEDEIYENFEKEAYDCFVNCQEEEREKESWYGTKKDVLGF